MIPLKSRFFHQNCRHISAYDIISLKLRMKFKLAFQTQHYDREPLTIKHKSVTWYRPTSLKDLLEFKSKHPDAKIVQGFSEIGNFLCGLVLAYVGKASFSKFVGVEVKFRFADYQN